jgi:cysteine sulfinate desulfinase/cysteine desulfurase-like protein
MQGLVYLDANATTPVDPCVADAVLSALTGLVGNPSSQHAVGRAARRAVEAARREVAALVGAERPDEIVFTSGGSESNVAAIHAALAARPGRRAVVTSAVEHASVQATLDRLDRAGIAASAGSACAAGGRRPSRVLAAMGLGRLAHSVIRFSLSRLNADADVGRLIALLPAIAAEARIPVPELLP